MTQALRAASGVLRLLLGLSMLLVVGSDGWTQGQIGPNDPCRHNDTQTDITVDLAAVVIVAPNQGLCGALIINMGTQDLRCRDTAYGDPTSTLGWPLRGGGNAELGIDAQPGLKCVRDTAATGPTTVNVTLKRP